MPRIRVNRMPPCKSRESKGKSSEVAHVARHVQKVMEDEPSPRLSVVDCPAPAWTRELSTPLINISGEVFQIYLNMRYNCGQGFSAEGQGGGKISDRKTKKGCLTSLPLRSTMTGCAGVGCLTAKGLGSPSSRKCLASQARAQGNRVTGKCW